MKKQSMLFPENEASVLTELDLGEAHTIADNIKAAVEAHCEKIDVAGSIRRQKPKVHDIDFVVVAKNDAEWQKINEKLKHLKAKPNCSGNSLIKAFLPCPLSSEREIVDNRPVWVSPQSNHCFLAFHGI